MSDADRPQRAGSLFDHILEVKHRERRIDDDLLDAFVAATHLVPVSDVLPDGQASLPILEQDGARYVAVFSSEAAWAESGVREGRHLRITGAQVIDLLPPGAGIAINPGAPVSLRLSAQALRQAVPARQTIPAGTRLRIGAPAREPVELLDRLRARLCYAGVRRAYRATVQLGDAAPELVVGVELDGTHSPAVVLGDLRSAIEPGQSVSFVLVDPQRPDTVAEWMITESEPFYPSGTGRGE